MAKEYGFRLLDKNTDRVVQDWQWFPNPEARAHVIRQFTISGEHWIEQRERDKAEDLTQRSN